MIVGPGGVLQKKPAVPAAAAFDNSNGPKQPNANGGNTNNTNRNMNTLNPF